MTDGSGKQASANFSLVIATGLTIATPPGLPTATVGVPYSDTLQAAGGASPYQWAVTAGSLPAGLSFDGTGTVSGTPTSSGTFPFTVEVTDAQSNRSSKQLTLAVAAGNYDYRGVTPGRRHTKSLLPDSPRRPAARRRIRGR